MGVFTLIVVAVLGLLGLALLLGGILLMVRLWDTLGQASEYFAREIERYRREYERLRQQR